MEITTSEIDLSGRWWRYNAEDGTLEEAFRSKKKRRPGAVAAFVKEQAAYRGSTCSQYLPSSEPVSLRGRPCATRLQMLPTVKPIFDTRAGSTADRVSPLWYSYNARRYR